MKKLLLITLCILPKLIIASDFSFSVEVINLCKVENCTNFTHDGYSYQNPRVRIIPGALNIIDENITQAIRSFPRIDIHPEKGSRFHQLNFNKNQYLRGGSYVTIMITADSIRGEPTIIFEETIEYFQATPEIIQHFEFLPDNELKNVQIYYFGEGKFMIFSNLQLLLKEHHFLLCGMKAFLYPVTPEHIDPQLLKNNPPNLHPLFFSH